MQEGIKQRTSRVKLNSEFFDVPRFSGDAYVDAFATYLRDKYVPWPPDVIVANREESLLTILRHLPGMGNGMTPDAIEPTV